MPVPSSLADLEKKIELRAKGSAEFIAQYPNLRLGGVISPWKRADERKDWMLKDGCVKSTLRNMADFQPLITRLLTTYDYVWIYAASAAPYNPYDEEIASVYNSSIGQALSKASRR